MRLVLEMRLKFIYIREHFDAFLSRSPSESAFSTTPPPPPPPCPPPAAASLHRLTDADVPLRRVEALFFSAAELLRPFSGLLGRRTELTIISARLVLGFCLGSQISKLRHGAASNCSIKSEEQGVALVYLGANAK